MKTLVTGGIQRPTVAGCGAGESSWRGHRAFLRPPEAAAGLRHRDAYREVGAHRSYVELPLPNRAHGRPIEEKRRSGPGLLDRADCTRILSVRIRRVP